MWQEARSQFPNLKFLNEAGSGEEFLVFHREMIRHFKWQVDQTPEADYRYEPWPDIPSWIVAAFEQSQPGYLAAAQAEIQRLVQVGTLDELGAFIEATQTALNPARNLHNRTHGLISAMERNVTIAAASLLSIFSPVVPITVDDADMGNLATSPHNDHFWQLHGWIDERYADWQRAHGETVDQSPLEHMHHGMFVREVAPIGRSAAFAEAIARASAVIFQPEPQVSVMVH